VVRRTLTDGSIIEGHVISFNPRVDLATVLYPSGACEDLTTSQLESLLWLQAPAPIKPIARIAPEPLSPRVEAGARAKSMPTVHVNRRGSITIASPPAVGVSPNDRRVQEVPDRRVQPSRRRSPSPPGSKRSVVQARASPRDWRAKSNSRAVGRRLYIPKHVSDSELASKEAPDQAVAAMRDEMRRLQTQLRSARQAQFATYDAEAAAELARVEADATEKHVARQMRARRIKREETGSTNAIFGVPIVTSPFGRLSLSPPSSAFGRLSLSPPSGASATFLRPAAARRSQASLAARAFPPPGRARSSPADRARIAAMRDFVGSIQLRATQLQSGVAAFNELANALEAGGSIPIAGLSYAQFSQRIQSYAAVHLRQHSLQESTIASIFRAVDVDESGALSLAELKCALATLFALTAEEASSIMFNACDGSANGGRGDGLLQMREFTVAFRSIIAIKALLNPENFMHISVHEVGAAHAVNMFVEISRETSTPSQALKKGLTKSQFCSWFVSAYGSSATSAAEINVAIVDEAISAFDTDGDGKLDEDELLVAMNSSTGSGKTVTKEEVKAMIEAADVDGDGQLDRDELLALLPEAVPGAARATAEGAASTKLPSTGMSKEAIIKRMRSIANETPSGAASSSDWWMSRDDDGEVEGPFSRNDMLYWLEDGTLDPLTQVAPCNAEGGEVEEWRAIRGGIIIDLKSPSDWWMCRDDDGEVEGPFSRNDMLYWLEDGTLDPLTQVAPCNAEGGEVKEWRAIRGGIVDTECIPEDIPKDVPPATPLPVMKEEDPPTPLVEAKRAGATSSALAALAAATLVASGAPRVEERRVSFHAPFSGAGSGPKKAWEIRAAKRDGGAKNSAAETSVALVKETNVAIGADGDGNIDEDELLVAMNSSTGSSKTVTKEEVKAMVEADNVDGGGQLDRDELLALLPEAAHDAAHEVMERGVSPELAKWLITNKITKASDVLKSLGVCSADDLLLFTEVEIENLPLPIITRRKLNAAVVEMRCGRSGAVTISPADASISLNLLVGLLELVADEIGSRVDALLDLNAALVSHSGTTILTRPAFVKSFETYIAAELPAFAQDSRMYGKLFDAVDAERSGRTSLAELVSGLCSLFQFERSEMAAQIFAACDAKGNGGRGDGKLMCNEFAAAFGASMAVEAMIAQRSQRAARRKGLHKAEQMFEEVLGIDYDDEAMLTKRQFQRWMVGSSSSSSSSSTRKGGDVENSDTTTAVVDAKSSSRDVLLTSTPAKTSRRMSYYEGEMKLSPPRIVGGGSGANAPQPVFVVAAEEETQRFQMPASMMQMQTQSTPAALRTLARSTSPPSPVRPISPSPLEQQYIRGGGGAAPPYIESPPTVMRVGRGPPGGPAATKSVATPRAVGSGSFKDWRNAYMKASNALVKVGADPSVFFAKIPKDTVTVRSLSNSLAASGVHLPQDVLQQLYLFVISIKKRPAVST